VIGIDRGRLARGVRAVQARLDAARDTVAMRGRGVITVNSMLSREKLASLQSRGTDPLELDREQKSQAEGAATRDMTRAIILAGTSGQPQIAIAREAIMKGARAVVESIRQRMIRGQVGTNQPGYLESKRDWQARTGHGRYGSAYSIRSGGLLESIVAEWRSNEGGVQ